jgi:hypothetical protein
VGAILASSFFEPPDPVIFKGFEECTGFLYLKFSTIHEQPFQITGNGTGNLVLGHIQDPGNGAPHQSSLFNNERLQASTYVGKKSQPAKRQQSIFNIP